MNNRAVVSAARVVRPNSCGGLLDRPPRCLISYIREFNSHDDIVDACCKAWNDLTDTQTSYDQSVAELVLTEELPNVLGRIEFGRIGCSLRAAR
jgi:hypothetical protein